ncbi:MAG: S8 family serine peptidase, partial [Bacteroidota bacterium]
MKNSFLLIISIMALTTCFSQQVMTPALQDAMESKEKNTLEVIVYFNDQVNLKEFDREMKAKKSTGSQRIRTLRQRLETTAKQTQDAFLKRLQGLQRSNDIHIKQKFWIRNAMLINTKPELINALAADKAVRRIDINSGRYRIEEPVKQEPSTKRSVGATEPGLEVVNAPPMWDMGYTGRNTLFLSIDTGVFTDHPALSDRYAGNHFPLDYVWYSMRNPFPTDHSSSSHGTHTTGTVLGLEKETNDTIGMAWEAYWISSDPVSSSDSDILDPAVFMEVFEWVLDPDGNPATTNDVPDVINNSWGYDYDMALEMNACELEEAHILEVIEAAGILCPFSAGNDGPGISTLGFPAMLAYNGMDIGIIQHFSFGLYLTFFIKNRFIVIFFIFVL